LDSAEFVSSVFKGSRIVIREYSTAPLAYNIELIGTPEAVSYFQKNLPQLQASFKDRHYRFRVNRLEAGLSQDAISIVERKKPVGDSEEE
jgi:hypothetical protein